MNTLAAAKKTVTGLTLLFLSLLIVACAGGGTSGTGDVRSATFEGLLLDNNGQPLSEVNVFVLETGDAAKTNGEGMFTLESKLSSAEAELLVELPQGERRVQITNIPQESSTIALILEVSADTTVVTVEAIEITVNSQPTPAPTPIQTPGAGSPTPAPTPPSADLISIFKGKLLFRDGVAIPGATVTIEPVKGRDTTDDQGRFQVTSKNTPSRIRVTVQYKGRTGTVTIDGLPEGQVITLSFTLRLQFTSKDVAGVDNTRPLPIDAESVRISPR